MALPKEPRQKMINLMYLVLTALLALNVSSEILNAFKTVNHSLNNATTTIEDKNSNLFKSLQRLKEDPKTADSAAKWAPRAELAKKYADDINSYIGGLKDKLKREAGWNPEKGDTTYKEDNLEAATRLMDEKGEGKILLQKLTEYKEKLLSIDPIIASEFKTSLPIDLTMPEVQNKSNNTWTAAYFRMTPTIAAITILSKFQNDVRNSESQIVEFCHTKIGAVRVIYDQFQAFAGTNSQYLMPGQELQITAGVGAFSKAAQPSVTIDGASVPIGSDGAALYKTSVGGSGSYTKKVVITFIKPDGTKGSIEKDVPYTVGSPTGITVSADAIKVLYIGLDNPISITGGSKGAESIQASISQGNLDNKGGGKYIATVQTPGKATISVKTSDGKVETSEFRVKTVPPPTPKVGRLAGGRMSANEFKSQVGLRADLENFVFEGVKYDVTGFTIICTGKGFEATGPKVAENSGAYFTSESKAIIEMCKAGSTVIFDRIRVTGPGGSQTLPQTIAFNLSN